MRIPKGMVLFFIFVVLSVPSYSDQYRYYKYVDSDAAQNLIGKFPMPSEAGAKINCYKFTYDANNKLSSIEYFKHGIPAIDSYNQCFKVLIEYFPSFERRFFYDVDGNRMKDFRGAYAITQKRDNSAKNIILTVFNKDGHQDYDRFYVSQYLYALDENGFVKNEMYFDKYGTRIESSSAYESKFKHDAKGNKIESASYDRKGMLITYYIPIQRHKYDDYGLVIEESRFNSDDQPVVERGKSATERYTRGQDGAIKFVYYFGVDGMPAYADTLGIAAMEITYNEYGDKIEEKYYGLDGKLIDREDRKGLAIIRFKYDESGNNIEEAYFDKNGKPVIPEDAAGVAIIKKVYDKNRRLIKRSYYGVDGNARNHKIDGIVATQFKYDNFGNMIKESFYGGDGRLKGLKTSKVAVYKYQYDRRGKFIKTLEYDAKGTEIKFGQKNNRKKTKTTKKTKNNSKK